MKQQQMQKRPPLQKGIVKRLIKSLFHYYPRMLTIALVCIVVNAVISSLPAFIMLPLFDYLEGVAAGTPWDAVSGYVAQQIGILIGMYAISLVAGATYNQLMAIITQGYLRSMREQMFNGMQDLPIRYFDTQDRKSVV